ncbi:hypothetical protein HPP92_013159 [Vanilla planifolia]|uniref:Cytochrome P450 n=1 Tax=Vanilla planifolia TaxID=51239 RepID=A0A835QYI4_VANPL|nr:hypothetical protein HPP92_013159 [Vanilla planifolia]
MLLSAASATVARAVFGKECVHERSFLSARKQTNKYLSGFGAVDVFPTLTSLGVIGGVRRGMQRVHRDIDAIFNEIIEEHEAKGLKGVGAGDDIVDVLLKLQSRDIRLISCRNRHLIRNSEIGDGTARPESPFMQMAQAEVRKALKGKTKIKEKDIIKLPYLNNVIKETLRVHPVVSLVHRVFYETVEIGGYTVPAGSRVVVNAWAIMRDARWWEDPERFMPVRFEKLEALDSGGAVC